MLDHPHHFCTKVYIVTGRAVPEGNTVYVMVQELTRYGEPRATAIWKPSTGEGFDARDARYDVIGDETRLLIPARYATPCTTTCSPYVPCAVVLIVQVML